MIKRIAAIVGMGLVVIMIAACDVMPGGSCHNLGERHTNDDGNTYVCGTNTLTGKPYWRKD